MRGSGKTPGLPFAKRSVQQAVRVFFRWERIFVFMLKPWDFRAFFLPFMRFPLYNSYMTENLLAAIKSSLADRQGSGNDEKKATWLIFTIGKAADGRNLYAIHADEVKEILRNADVFPLPFAPAYVSGVLNRYGTPYVVIDTAVMEGKAAQDSALFIVLNDASHSCLKITDVKDFFSAEEKDIVHFAEEELSGFYEGTLAVSGQKALVVKVGAIIAKAGEEIAAA